jgi:hypothetical protein
MSTSCVSSRTFSISDLEISSGGGLSKVEKDVDTARKAIVEETAGTEVFVSTD